jgi:ABC-type transport system involved in cytochrome c biogenesis permease subunit
MGYFKSIDWKKFLKYELFCIGLVLGLYFNSPNKFPHNFYAVYTIPILFGIMLIVGSYSNYIQRKNGQEKNYRGDSI